MSQFDHLDLDGHLLRLLLAVIEEGSVTSAAHRLGVTQSAVSHLLDKLRAIVGDPLFVKSGRGIVPTARARELAVQARTLLDQLRSFSSAVDFDPAKLSALVTIAANDWQRDLLLPSFLRYVRAQAPGVSLRVIPSGAPTTELLRGEHCQLAITPRPPEASDILQKRLFEDTYRVFYDASQREAPATLEDYLAADHVTVLHEPGRPLEFDEWLAERGVRRRFAAQVPGFSGIAPFLRGSTMIATFPSLLRAHMLRDFAVAPVPLECPVMPMFMVWHLRHQADPMHRWLRQQLEIVVAPALATRPGKAVQAVPGRGRPQTLNRL
jgi:DNA-binding transcriptional LysR family regulator